MEAAMFKLELSYTDILKRAAVFILIALTLNIIIFQLTPFLLAALIAIILERPVALLAKKTPRLPAVLIVLTLFFLLMVLLFLIISSNLIGELMDLARLLPRYSDQIVEGINELVQRQEDFYEIVPDEIAEVISQNIDMIFQRVNIMFSQALNRFLDFTFNIPMMFIFVIFTILATFYMSKDKGKLLNYFSGKVNLEDREKAKLLKDFTAYIRVQLMIITNTTLWVWLTLRFMGIPYALLLGLLAGLLDLIPVVGPGGVLWALMGIHLLINPLYSLILLIVYFIVQSFRPFLEARVLATNIGVHPLILLLGLFLGLSLYGFKGIILAPLSIIIFKVLVLAGLI